MNKCANFPYDVIVITYRTGNMMETWLETSEGNRLSW